MKNLQRRFNVRLNVIQCYYLPRNKWRTLLYQSHFFSKLNRHILTDGILNGESLLKAITPWKIMYTEINTWIHWYKHHKPSQNHIKRGIKEAMCYFRNHHFQWADFSIIYYQRYSTTWRDRDNITENLIYLCTLFLPIKMEHGLPINALEIAHTQVSLCSSRLFSWRNNTCYLSIIPH